MKKTLLVLSILCAIVFSVFADPFITDSAYNGVYSLSSIKTEHFEFIYPDSLEKEALHLYQYAEGVYRDLIDYFGAPWNVGRLSVVLTKDKSTNLNAYYSPYTNSHVVIYVTSPDEGDLFSYKDTLLSTFEHEVAHAYTLKIHDPAMQGASIFFGDYFCNGMFLPNMMIEGLSVAFESRGNDGRLNNPFVMTQLRQALHEQKFPEWRYLMGWAESEPYPELEYIAGGAFIDFLRREYGTKKFHDFINGFGNMFSFPYLFSRIYGMDISEAWRTFIASLPYPNDIVFPKKAVSDNGRYKALKYADGAFYFSDIIAKEIYRYDVAGVKKIADIEGVFDSFNVSFDGRYYAYVSKWDDKSVLRVYERDNGRILTLNNIKHIAFSTYKSEAIVVGERTNGSYNDIVAYSIKGELLYSYPLAYGVEAVSFASFDEGTFAFVFRDDTGTRLAIHNMASNKSDVYSFPGKLVRDIASVKINESSIIVTLSYVNKSNTFNIEHYPNVMILNFNKGGKLLSTSEGQVDVDGGIWNPVICEDTVYFISKKFSNDNISSMKLEDLKLVESNVIQVGLLKTRQIDNSVKNYIGTVQDYDVMNLAEPHTYSRFVNSIPFVRKGALLPVVYDRKNDALRTELGLSYTTSDPTESVSSVLSFAYNPRPYVRNKAPKWFETNRLTFELGWEVDILPVKLYFGARPYLYIDRDTGLSVFGDFFMVADYKKTIKSNTNYVKSSLTFGWNGKFKGEIDVTNDGFYGKLSTYYNDMAKVGYGYKEYKGWRVGANVHLQETTHFKPLFLQTNIFTNLFIPHIIPVKNLPTATFNLPIQLFLSMGYKLHGARDITRGVEEEYAHLTSALFGFKFVVFSFNVDKIISDYFPFAINNFTLEADSNIEYNWVKNYQNTQYHLMTVGVGVEGYFTISAAFLSAVLASSKVDLGVRYDMEWQSDSRIDNFSMYGTSSWGKVSLIARLNVSI